MERVESIHAGHRDRLIKKFLANPQTFADHEVLEMLLFYALPRVDTNAIAHKLLNSFGSLNEVFQTSVEKLQKVLGIGEKAAALIKAIGIISERREVANNKITFKASVDVKNELAKFYTPGVAAETFLLILLNSKREKIMRLVYSDNNKQVVTASIPEIVNAFAITKPAFAIIAHNHTSGNATPSVEDDLATKKMKLICDMHGVMFIDHVIVAGTDFYSYHENNRMDYIKQAADLNNLLNQLKQGDNL